MKWAKKIQLPQFVYAMQQGHPFTLFDVETTGLKPTDYIVQFSGLRMEKGADGKYHVTIFYRGY